MATFEQQDMTWKCEPSTGPIDLEKTTFVYQGREVPGKRLAELLGLVPLEVMHLANSGTIATPTSVK